MRLGGCNFCNLAYILCFYSETFLHYETGWGHPESPERLRAIAKNLQQSLWASQLLWQSPTNRNSLNIVLHAHTEDYIEQGMAQEARSLILRQLTRRVDFSAAADLDEWLRLRS
jgi:acetoin utilization deacetylase AcuC-like enzyme